MVTATGLDQIYFQVDDSWPGDVAGLPTIDVREEAKGLRCVTNVKRVEAFAARHASDFRPFTLTGSGDFHHLSALWIRQFKERFLLLSFDNHPDWDIRSPKWGCGAWINRALEDPHVRGASIWGCGNNECESPRRKLGNKEAALAGKLAVHPWRRPKSDYPHWLLPTTPETWRAEFADWAVRHAGEKLYVTVDLDCLQAGEAATNWENGRFTVEDIVWALGVLHDKMKVIGGDLCGAWSEQRYATFFQKVAGWWDHPAEKRDLPSRLPVNEIARQRIWQALTAPVVTDD